MKEYPKFQIIGIKRMHLGIDFDNTVVTYDRIFHKYALREQLISCGVPKNKQKIRDKIRMLPQGNERWTELQALVYGCYMDEAEPADGIREFLELCKKKLVKVSIISHKTIYPAKGPRVNLRKAAIRWLREKGFLSSKGLHLKDVIFVGTLKEKLMQIEKFKCTHFVDDLLEVLQHPDFPAEVGKIFYAPGGADKIPRGIQCFRGWYDIQKYLFRT